MNPASPSPGSKRTQANIEPPVSSSPRGHMGEDEPAGTKPSCPPLRKDPAAYRGPDQPAWLECFFRGELTPFLDLTEAAEQLWMDSGSEESFESWISDNGNRQKAQYCCGANDGIHTYARWCIANNKPEALAWVIKKKMSNITT